MPEPYPQPRWLTVALGSPLLSAAPSGVIAAHRWRWRARRDAWSMKLHTPYMTFGVYDNRDEAVVWTTDNDPEENR